MAIVIYWLAFALITPHLRAFQSSAAKNVSTFGVKTAFTSTSRITAFSWTGWQQSPSMCGINGYGRTRLHKDVDSPMDSYDRYEEKTDMKYDRIRNIALHQPATQSSTYESFAAELVTDGIIITDMQFGSCSQTKLDTNPWLRIDLHQDGYHSYVEEVMIFNRYDCCSERANNITVTIGDNSDGNNNAVCKQQEDMNTRVIRLICKEGSFGRYLHIKVPGPQILHLCEVQALGGRYKNLALGKNAIAWKEDGNYPASQLVDGRLDLRAETDGGGKNPWFEIDLGQEALVYMVHLYIGSREGFIENSIVSVGSSGSFPFCGVVTPYNQLNGGKMTSYIVKCGKGLKGRYVKISMVSTSHFISLSEAEVFGKFLA